MWKALVFVLFCAVAHAQRGRSTTERPQPTTFSTGGYQSTKSSFSSSTYKPNSKSASSDLNSIVVESNGESKPNQQSSICKEKNERHPVSGSCDKYIECVDGVAEEKQCPDGLRYNPNLSFIAYPCVYPNQYQCLERSALQSPDPTEECPNQFGYFKLGNAANCTWFRNCVSGVGYDIACPEGLAYNPASYQCDWPDEVEECDVDAFLGFRCPELKISEDFGPPAAYRFFSSSDSCQKYFMCIGTKPRLLRCGGESAFDEKTNTCISAEDVESCPVELKQRAHKAREEESLRRQKEMEFSANPPLNKKRLPAISH